jgi:hypothetical protein
MVAIEDVGLFYGHLVYIKAIRYFYGHLVYFMAIWYIFSRFGMLYQERSGNPALNVTACFLRQSTFSLLRSCTHFLFVLLSAFLSLPLSLSLSLLFQTFFTSL